MLTVPTKQEAKLLETFNGLQLSQIIVPQTESEFMQAASEILSSKVVGFDTESKPVFKKGQKSTGPHVVQFSLLDKAFIFQLHYKDCLDHLVAVLSSDKVLKVGFGLKSDKKEIYNKFGVQINALLDLDSEFRKKGYRRQLGARTAVAVVFKQNFVKSRRISTSNWARPALSDSQLLYAANDAYVALRVYYEIQAT